MTVIIFLDVLALMDVRFRPFRHWRTAQDASGFLSELLTNIAGRKRNNVRLQRSSPGHRLFCFCPCSDQECPVQQETPIVDDFSSVDIEEAIRRSILDVVEGRHPATRLPCEIELERMDR